MKKLELSAIRIDGGTQARANLSQEVVSDYAEHLQEGAEFPPVTVFHDGSDYWLADGFHRYFANKSNGALDISVDIKNGTVRDAMLYAFSANGRRGFSMSKQDNQKIVTAMLKDPEWTKWSNSHIAKHVGVSAMTVGRIRTKLEESSEVKPKQEKKYVKEGEEKKMNTKEIGKSSQTSDDEPPPNHEVVSLEEKLHEMTLLVEQLTEENDTLKDQLMLKQWDASDIEKMDMEDVLKELRRQIKTLEAENETLRTSRDMYQNRNSELMKTVKSLQNKLKKA